MVVLFAVPPTDPTLSAADHCDVCGSRAYIRVLVNLQYSELMFCAHHGHEVEPVLLPKAVDWIDESGQLE